MSKDQSDIGVSDMTVSIGNAPGLPSLVERLSPISIGGMLLLAVLWGLSIPITKLGLEAMPPIAFTALRFSFAVPFLFLFAIGRHEVAHRLIDGVFEGGGRRGGLLVVVFVGRVPDVVPFRVV